MNLLEMGHRKAKARSFGKSEIRVSEIGFGEKIEINLNREIQRQRRTSGFLLTEE